MPRVRTRARANETVVLSSDDEEDVPQAHTSRRGRPRHISKSGPSTSKNGDELRATHQVPAGNKDISANDRLARKRKIEETKPIEIDLCSPSKCTRSSRRASGSLPSPRLTTEERCKLEIEKLTEKFGTEGDGFGVKVITESTGTVAYLTVIPKCSQARQFTLVLLSRGRADELKALKYFPPVRVRIDVSSTSTKFSVIGAWLLKTHLKKLTKEMNKVFRCHSGKHPIIGAVEWLEAKGIEESGSLFHRTLYYAAPDVVRKEPFHIAFHDIGMIRQMFIAARDRQENIVKTPTLRGITAFDCSICFEHKPVMTAVIFPGCNHYFCTNCVRQDFSLKVKENRIAEIQCLADQCQVKALLDSSTFKQYCDFSVENLVGGVSFTRCPKKECNAPMELPPDAAREVQCMVCHYRFCSTCKAKPHPKKPCLTDAQKREIREQCKKGDTRAKKDLEERFGADNVKFALQDAESEEWIAKNAKPCPKCKTNIEKTDGCNKMVCTAKGCHAYFCWLCGQELTGPNPYAHFQTGACSGRLHEGQQIMGGNPNFHGLFNAMINWNDDISDSEDEDDDEFGWDDDDDMFAAPPMLFEESDSSEDELFFHNLGPHFFHDHLDEHWDTDSNESIQGLSVASDGEDSDSDD